MSFVIVLSLLVCLLGLVLFIVLSDKPRRPAFRRVSEIMFAAGLLAFLFSGISMASCQATTTAPTPAVHTK